MPLRKSSVSRKIIGGLEEEKKNNFRLKEKFMNLDN
jgi:hypothetical protein